MRIAGQRKDGCLLVYVDGGMAVMLKGHLSTPAMDETIALSHGPWLPADNSLESRRKVAKQLDSARLTTVFALGDRSKYPDGLYPGEREAAKGGSHSAQSGFMDQYLKDGSEQGASAIDKSSSAKSTPEIQSSLKSLESAATPAAKAAGHVAVAEAHEAAADAARASGSGGVRGHNAAADAHRGASAHYQAAAKLESTMDKMKNTPISEGKNDRDFPMARAHDPK